MLEQEKLKSILEYDPETGLFRWKVLGWGRKAGWFGGTSGHRYLRVYVPDKQYFAHRLAWFYVYGSMPNGEIDHINGNRHDNRIVNLRIATRSQQLGNSRAQPRNKSGYKGVSWKRNRGKWCVQILNRYVGLFSDKVEAARAYDEKAKEVFGDFARLNFPDA